jgi:hypothetical protein
MPKTLAEWFFGAVLRWRLNSRVRPRRPAPSIPTRRTEMNLAFLDGYKTYIVAVAMLLAGASQLLGVGLPNFEGQSAGHLLTEGLAILFLRKGIKSTRG